MAFPNQNPEEISLEIDGTTFRFWTEIELNLIFDGHASVSFGAPFEPDLIEFRETFRPFAYKEVKVLVGGDVLFTGTMIDISPEVNAGSKMVSVTAYSRAAVLADCTAPAGHLPLEFNGLDLNQITKKLADPFGISLAVGADVGAKFERVKLEPEGKIQDFLADLAKKRGVILASDADGDLIYRQSATGPQTLVARLKENESPCLSVGATFSPQAYYSEVTCTAKTKHGRKGNKFTETNPFAVGLLRPSVQELDDTEPADVPTATKARIGRMFGAVVSYEINLSTWLTPDGDLWTPDQRLRLTAPGAMVYSESELMIRAVTLRAAPGSKTATLTCTLPGAFSGELPGNLPWLG